ncbi:MAG: sigma-70 family RNA polymerase sigma factor [Planctomycetota bacterium]|nr:sigma-70 family RNA polymerase sigma factor [Planctomycetota bacterium]
MSKEDASIIERVLNGETDAFEGLVRTYQVRLFNSLIHSLGCPEEAEDVAQEAFVKSFAKLATFKQNSSFYTWLYRIAINIAISRHRQKKPKSSLDEYRVNAGHEPVDESNQPGQKIDLEERAVQVQSALHLLSEEHRAIIVLREIEDMDYEAISDILNLPVGTVRSRLHRARQQLRTHLEHVVMEK